LYSLSGGAVNIDGKEDKTNKQNDLTADVTNLKYPTVTAVNTGLATKQKNTLQSYYRNGNNKLYQSLRSKYA
jgi:hypothetical protein